MQKYEQSKFKSELLSKYKRCTLSGDVTADAGHIVPFNISMKYNSFLNFTIYNGMVLRPDLFRKFEAHEFSFFPEAYDFSHKEGEIWCKVNLYNGNSVDQTKSYDILYLSIYFIKWHFIKCLKKRGAPTPINSDQCFNNSLLKMRGVRNGCFVDKDGDVIMFEKERWNISKIV